MTKYAIYHKNTIPSGSLSSHGRWERYDPKNYSNLKAAIVQTKKYERRRKIFARYEKGGKATEQYQIRPVRNNTNRRIGGGFW
jgi:hypothetical protein